MKLKKSFQLEETFAMKDRNWMSQVHIEDRIDKPYITFSVTSEDQPSKVIAISYLRGKELKRFAENILKILNK